MEKKKRCYFASKHQIGSKNDRENIHQHKTHKKKLEKFAVAEFDDMNQIEWVPFDPYGD